jgi:hypothetical protein
MENIRYEVWLQNQDKQPMINDRNSEIDEGFDDNNSDQKSECDGSKPPTPPPEGATSIIKQPV